MLANTETDCKLYIGDLVSFQVGGFYGDTLQGHVYGYLFNESGDMVAVTFRSFSEDYSSYNDYTEPVYWAQESTVLICRFEDSVFNQQLIAVAEAALVAVAV